MAFNTQPAWHGLGLDIGDNCRDSSLAIDAAGLNWKVEKRPILFNRTGGYETCSGVFANVRLDTEKLVGVVGNHYTSFQNRDAFSFFDPILRDHGGRYETAGSLYGGRRVWVLVKLDGEIRVKRDDVVKKYALLSNSHDGQSRVLYGFTGIRVCCTNTLRLALSDCEAFGGSRHRRNVANNVAAASRIMETAVSTFGKATELFTGMANVNLTAAQVNEYFRKVYYRPASIGWRAEDKLTELFETGRGNSERGVRGTLWAAYNAVTEYEDYRPYYAAENASRRLEHVWWGLGAKVKFRALQVARGLVQEAA